MDCGLQAARSKDASCAVLAYSKERAYRMERGSGRGKGGTVLRVIVVRKGFLRYAVCYTYVGVGNIDDDVHLDVSVNYWQ